MKIKVAILEQDVSYLSRITAAFHTRYADKMEIYGFTVYEKAIDELEKTKIDVFLANELIEVEKSRLPKTCGFAYLVESNGIETVRDTAAISKFQKADLIYKQILSIYSEKTEKISDYQMTILARDVAKKVEEEMEYPGTIKVNIIRETRVTDYAK